jgi:hypothetical protein
MLKFGLGVEVSRLHDHDDTFSSPNSFEYWSMCNNNKRSGQCILLYIAECIHTTMRLVEARITRV